MDGLLERHGFQYTAFHGEAGANADQQSELLAFTGGGEFSLDRRLPNVGQDEQHARAAHVAVVRENLSARVQFFREECQLLFDLVEDSDSAGMHSPEEVVAVGVPSFGSGVRDEFLDACGDELGDVR